MNEQFFIDLDPAKDPETGEAWEINETSAPSAPERPAAPERPKVPEKPRRVEIKDGRVLVEFPYDAAVVEIVKEIARKFGARRAYQPEEKLWLLPLESSSEVRNFLYAHGFAMSADFNAQADATDKIQSVDMAFAAACIEASKDGLEAQPFDGGKVLYEHQQFAVREALELQRLIIADDMGLGKTLETLMAAKIIKETTGANVVVIAPASLLTNWHREAAMVGLKISVYSWAKIPEASYFHGDYVLIADEAHYAQNPKSQRTQAFWALALDERCRACYPLTGTPMKNAQPANLFPLLKAIRHPLAKVKSSFETRYCNAQRREFRNKKTGKVVRFWDNSGASHIEELREKVGRHLLRRRKVDCLDLPAKTRIVKRAEISAEAESVFKAKFREAEKAYHRRVEIGKGIEAQAVREGWTKERTKDEMKAAGGVTEEAEALATLTFLRKASSEAKVESTIADCEEILEQGGQPIVFVMFRETAAVIANHFKVTPLIGETPKEVRQRIVDDFQAGRQRVFVGSIAAGGVGLTLTASNHVILHDRPLTPGDAEQAEDRAHRIGQNWPVTASWPQAFEVDEQIDELLVDKIARIAKGIDGLGDDEVEKIKNSLSPRAVLNRLFKDED